jgi:hypothetical protein
VKRRRNKQHRRMQFETLEPRQVLAAGVTATLTSGGVLNVVGTDWADQIEFKQVGKYLSVNGVSGSWSATKVKSIFVDLKAGDDYVSFASLANGGNKALKEKITVKSGIGNEQVRLASLHDVYMDGTGHTLTVSGSTTSLDGAVLNLTNKTIASYSSGVLKVTGTNGGDSLAFRQTNGKIYISNVAGSWSASKVKSIIVYLQDGNDYVSFDSLASGGNQVLSETITVRSGAGNETVRLANGHDVTFSGLGHTLSIATNGTVKLDGQTLSWDNDPTPPPPTPPNPNPNWFDTNIQDAALRVLGSSLYVDSLISRADVLSLLNSAKDGSVVDATELADLRRMVDNASLFGADDYTRSITSYVTYGTVANTNSGVGNLVANSNSTHLDNLVNKWFLGLDRPVASGTYKHIAGTLFVGGAQYSDVNQGSVGDCYYLAALAEIALRSNSTITSMFTVNGDGTYGVKFKNPSGQNVYVTVDSYLPTNGSYMVYAHVATSGAWTYSSTNELWVALAEKAYAQLNEFGWSRAGFADSGKNSYAAISGGYIGDAFAHVTGQATSWRMTDTDYNPGSNTANYNFTTFVNAYNAGKLIGFASYSTPASGSVVGGHAYAVVGYNASNKTITLYNPWGLNNGSAAGIVTMSWSQIQQSFAYFDYTA